MFNQLNKVKSKKSNSRFKNDEVCALQRMGSKVVWGFSDRTHEAPHSQSLYPNIHIGGMPGSSSVEHLVTLKTCMLMKEEKKENGIFQVFDMEKFFDKESLIDTMYTLNKKANISDKDYRL